eukprot:1197470-Amphidinium_carterae.1
MDTSVLTASSRGVAEKRSEPAESSAWLFRAKLDVSAHQAAAKLQLLWISTSIVGVDPLHCPRTGITCRRCCGDACTAAPVVWLPAH